MRAYIWKIFNIIRNIKILFSNKKIRCLLGIHRMRYGFGWSKNTRMDICYDCNYKKYHKDKLGWLIISKENK